MQRNTPQTPAPVLMTLQITTFCSFKTIVESKEIYAYDKIQGIYKPYGDTLIRALLRNYYPTHSTNDRHEVIHEIEDTTWIRRNEFDNKKRVGYIPLKQYLVNCNDLSDSVGYDKDYYYTFKYPFNYNPKARCPKFLKFMQEILPDRPIDIIRVLEGFASGLVPQLRFEKAYMFVGPKAQNGKSTLFNIMSTVLGKENISNVSIHDLKYGRFQRAGIVDKSYNIYADIDSKALRELGIIKMIISGDPMTMERKNQEGFSYSPKIRLFFSSNQPPIIDEDSNAVYRRFMLVEFPVEFRKHDPLFEKKFEDEYEGIMSLLVRLAVWLYHTKKLRYLQSPEELRVIWDLKSNPISKFMDDMLIRTPGGSVEHGDLYSAYVKYCMKNHFTVELMNTFTRLFKKKGNKQHKTNSKYRWLEWKIKEIPEDQSKLSEEP